MKLLLLSLSSVTFFFSIKLYAASCCVSNTSVSNLMIFPSTWQETVSLSQGRVIGDVGDKGTSTFRRNNNKDITNLAKLDLAYGWNSRYQTGVSIKYQSRKRDFHGEDSSASGWNDLGLSHAYKLPLEEKIWVFNTLNIPTATSVYDSNSSFAVDARGTGTYQTSVGLFGLKTFKDWDYLYSSEVHRSFGRNFSYNGTTTQVSGFWGASLTAGIGYIPWKSKARYGVALTPRYEGPKDVTVNGSKAPGKNSLVWDSSINFSYTLTANHALGLNYVDQTLIGPARNTLLSRSVVFQWQSKWE